MTNPERHARIEAIYNLAALEQRPISVAEMDEIDQLSEAIYAEAQKWLNSILPIPEGASPSLKSQIEGRINSLHSHLAA